MKSKPLWIIIAFLLWGAGSTYWYVCKIKGFCPSQKTNVITSSSTSRQKAGEKLNKNKSEFEKDLIYYKWNSSEPVINNDTDWTAEVKSIAQLRAEGKKLRIEAPYYAQENNDSGYENLGLARAEALKKMFAKDLDTTQIITAGVLLKDSLRPEFINGYKNYIKWVAFNKNVQEKHDKTLVYFPVNSTREIKNKAIISYIDELVEKMKKNQNYKLELTGYTDNTGDTDKNYQLGLGRAERIKNLLLSKGVDSNRIIVKSEGEKNPVADNDTPEGRQKNRRVEIRIIF